MKWEFEIQNNWQGKIKLALLKAGVIIINLPVYLFIFFPVLVFLSPLILLLLAFLSPTLAYKLLIPLLICMIMWCMLCLYCSWRIVKSWEKIPGQ